MRLYTLAITLSLVGLVVLSGCKRDTEQAGPSIGPLTNKEDLSASKTSVDLSAGETVVISAEFNRASDWTLTLTGETTGATKVYTGTDAAISVDWAGNSTDLPLFGVEDVSVVLTAEGQNEAGEDTTITLTQNNLLTLTSEAIITGTIVADFENEDGSNWTPFAQFGANMVVGQTTTGTAPQGSGYYNIEGTVNWDFLIADLKIDPKSGTYFDVSSNQNNVYFNVMINGDATNSNGSFYLIRLMEDDDGDGVWEGGSEDMYEMRVDLDYDGWKKHNWLYSDLLTVETGDGSSGNKQFNPDKIVQVHFLMLIDPAAGFGSGDIDLPIFTTGDAF